MWQKIDENERDRQRDRERGREVGGRERNGYMHT